MPMAMFARRGQTAFEYLLILVVVMSVIVAVFIYLRVLGQGPLDSATEHTDSALCAMKNCSYSADCQKYPECGSNSTCFGDRCAI